MKKKNRKLNTNRKVPKDIEEVIYPRPMSRVVYVGDQDAPYAFGMNDILLYLGELPNMEGHCAIVDKSGRTFYGYHIDNFEEFDDENEEHLKIIKWGN
jgi:hypothetical protein